MSPPIIKHQQKLKSMNSSQFQKTHIVVENLNLYIQDNHILKDINLSIPDKSITCIIGPSGCGKTTLLRSFNRLHDDSVDVKITGKLYGVPSCQEFIFQEPDGPL